MNKKLYMVHSFLCKFGIPFGRKRWKNCGGVKFPGFYGNSFHGYLVKNEKKTFKLDHTQRNPPAHAIKHGRTMA